MLHTALAIQFCSGIFNGSVFTIDDVNIWGIDVDVWAVIDGETEYTVPNADLDIVVDNGIDDACSVDESVLDDDSFIVFWL